MKEKIMPYLLITLFMGIILLMPFSIKRNDSVSSNITDYVSKTFIFVNNDNDKLSFLKKYNTLKDDISNNKIVFNYLLREKNITLNDVSNNNKILYTIRNGVYDINGLNKISCSTFTNLFSKMEAIKDSESFLYNCNITGGPSLFIDEMSNDKYADNLNDLVNFKFSDLYQNKKMIFVSKKDLDNNILNIFNTTIDSYASYYQLDDKTYAIFDSKDDGYYVLDYQNYNTDKLIGSYVTEDVDNYIIASIYTYVTPDYEVLNNISDDDSFINLGNGYEIKYSNSRFKISYNNHDYIIIEDENYNHDYIYNFFNENDSSYYMNNKKKVYIHDLALKYKFVFDNEKCIEISPVNK